MSVFETSDGAKLYYEDHGKGAPLVLLHGWTCSSVFWQRNAPELAKDFRIITMDSRGHGNSSKILTGHTISQYARDVRALIEHLYLQNVTLVGWSLSGPVVLSYWEQFFQDSRLQGIGLLDMTPAPFSPAEWNSHSLKNYNYSAMHATFAAYLSNPMEYATSFAHKMFKGGKASLKDVQWIVAEMAKIPPWIAIAAYSDYLMSDFTHVLPTVTVPLIVFAGNSDIFKNGIEQGEHVANLAAKPIFVPFEDAGHILFFEKPEKFNRAVADFMAAAHK
jgi:pimeloyl-ACP methyl ester carboxylesterase